MAPQREAAILSCFSLGSESMVAGPPERGVKGLYAQRSFLGQCLLDWGLRTLAGPQLMGFGSLGLGASLAGSLCPCPSGFSQ